jgi:ATP-dependent exoDNAse (exonuclease V) alpha subunit
MCLKNDNQAKLFNGMQGYVKFLSAKQKNKLTFESDGIQYDIVFDPDQFNKEKVENFGKKDDPMPMDYCYAATCHKCQGDEFEVGYVLEQQCQFWEAVRWVYTAASRFKKEVYWIEQY